MTSSQHIRSAFDRDLEMITSKMLKMGGLVESSIVDAAEAFEKRDLELAQNVRKRDKKIDALEAEIWRFFRHRDRLQGKQRRATSVAPVSVRQPPLRHNDKRPFRVEHTRCNNAVTVILYLVWYGDPIQS